MIAPSNELGTDAWLNVLDLLDDHYVRQLARLWLAQLAPGQRLNVEYSNEIWNPDFESFLPAQWVQEQDLALGLSNDPTVAATRRQANRSAEIFAIFEEEWAGSRDRLTFVLAPWIAFPELSEELLSSFESVSVNGVSINPTGVEADALALGAYFGPPIMDELFAANAISTATTTTSDVLELLRAEINGEIRDLVFAQAAVAESHGLELMAYEGGQHLVAHGAAQWDPEVQAPIAETNRDQGMYDLYNELLDMWDEAGGGLFTAYQSIWHPDPWGAFEILEYVGQPIEDAPKYRALVDRLAQSDPVPPPFVSRIVAPALASD